MKKLSTMLITFITSIMTVNALDYVTAGAAFSPTLNIFESQYFDNYKKEDAAKILYNTMSFGLDLSFGTIYDKHHYYKKLYEENEDKIDSSYWPSIYTDDYSFTEHNVTIYYTFSGDGAIDYKTYYIDNYKFGSNDVKLRGIKITYDLSWNKKHTLSDNVAFYAGVIPWSCSFSYLGGNFEEYDVTAINIDIWRLGFNLGFHFKINNKGDMIKIGTRPMITLFELRTLRLEAKDWDDITLYTEPFRQYNMLRNITCPIVVSYVFIINKK